MITVNKSLELTAAQAALCDQVDAKRLGLIAAGLNWQGNVFQIDDGSQAIMTTMMLAYTIGQTNPSGGVWRSAANVNVPMTDAQVKALILGAQTYVKGLLYNGWALKDQINKLTTLAAVAAFDITQGWPANNG